VAVAIPQAKISAMVAMVAMMMILMLFMMILSFPLGVALFTLL
jgi:hypothetical protein